MATLKVLGHHTVYRNSQPSRFSEYVAFPALVTLADNTLLCMCRHGTARESADGEARIHRSTDGGRTWSPLPSLPKPDSTINPLQLPGGLAVTSGREVVAWMKARHTMADQPANYVSRSSDNGQSWTTLQRVDFEPFVGGATVSQLSGLSDGTLILTGETPGDGARIDANHWITLISSSSDGGHTWEKIRAVHDSVNPHHFDLRITDLADGRWLAAYWTHDVQAERGLNVHLATSSDGGATWTAPFDAGFWGQLTAVFRLQSGRVLAVTNHRRPPLGIRALLSEDAASGSTTFDENDHIELWGIEPPKVRNAPTLAPKRDVVEQVLKSYHYFTFGTPTIAQSSDGTIVVAFYVTEESVTYVRCCRLIERP